MSERGPLRVGVWCGPLNNRNPFVDVFSQGLRSAGATIVEFESPIDVKSDRFDVLHVHWPEQVFWSGGGLGRVALRALRTLAALYRLKRKGAVIVWMVHNLRPHDLSRKQRAIWRVFSGLLCQLVDAVMTLSPGTMAPVCDSLRGLRRKPIKAVWHPSYPRHASDLNRDDLRRKLGIGLSDRVFGCYGLLRPYKGIELLIEAFKRSSHDSDRLLIAGAPIDSAYVNLLKAMAAFDRRISIDARHLSDSDLASNYIVSDVIVLPFNNSLHSGSIVHALSEERVILTPLSPFASSLSREVGEGWLKTYDRPLTVEAMISCVKPLGAPNLEALAPDVVGRETLAFYRQLTSDRAKHRALP